jgi:uncharacterized membrane protein
MILLAAGLALWTLAHLPKGVDPERRARLAGRFGAGASRGAFAAAIGIGLILMIVGYRQAPYVDVWTPPAWTVHLNNLLMLIAVFVFGMSMSKGRTRSWLRHPMLVGVAIWATAHLLVNGDAASLLLFGGLGVWALAEMALINAREPAWTPKPPGPVAGDVRLVAITVLAFALITGVHAWLGVWPFPGR